MPAARGGLVSARLSGASNGARDIMQPPRIASKLAPSEIAALASYLSFIK
jgi:hypothetical protein